MDRSLRPPTPSTRMIQRHLFWAFLVLLNLPLQAQTKTERATVEWGPEMNDSKDGAFDMVVGYTDDFVYMLVWQKKERFLRKMDASHRIVYQKLLPMEIDKDDHALETVQVLDDRILVFSSYFDKKADINTLFVRSFSEAGFAPMGRMQRVAVMAAEGRRAGSFSVRISPDERMILVDQQLPYEKEGRERFKLSVFDRDLTPMWERSVDLPYLDSEFAVVETRVTNDGAVIMIGNKYAEKRAAKELRKDGKATYTYHVLTYQNDGSEPEDNPIDIADKFLQDLTLNIGDEGEILCGGFYGKKGSFAVSGTFFLKLDQNTKQVTHSSFKEFDADFITQYMTEKEEAKASKRADKKGEEIELYNYELRDIVRRTDGGAVMVGEQYRFYVTTTTTSSPNGGTTTTTTYHYIYNDIIVVNVDPSGEIEWAAKVPKRQHSTNDGGRYSSYAMVVKEDNIYLLFNDSGKNLFLTPGDKVEPFRYGKDMLITLATINGDGKVSREALLAQEKREAMTRPKAGVQIGDDRLFIYANWRKDHQYGTVTFR
ncbi:MAG: hypothetical protein IPH05_09115 [Flavobacteriales bacterium]|nr:hypothetical protein [Flavobacteriales bacterium]